MFTPELCGAGRQQHPPVIGGKRPIIIDDMISTGGTIARCVGALLEKGALPDVRVVATHGVFVGRALEYLAHPAISEVVTTDTIPPPAEPPANLRVVSIAPLLAEAIRRIHTESSVSEVFER